MTNASKTTHLVSLCRTYAYAMHTWGAFSFLKLTDIT